MSITSPSHGERKRASRAGRRALTSPSSFPLEGTAKQQEEQMMRLLHQRLRTDERARRTASKRTSIASFASFVSGLGFSVTVSVLAVQGVQLAGAIGDAGSGLFPTALFIALGLVGLGTAVASLWLWLRRQGIEKAVMKAEIDAHRMARLVIERRARQERALRGESPR